MSLILGLDCTGETYSLGLCDGAGLQLEVAGYQPRRALREMSGGLKYLLATAKARATDLTAVGVTEGPGSFTGVRLGITIAKTVALVAGCPLWGVDTLELLAHQHLPEGSLGTVAVALDARRGELYCGIFQRLPEGLQTVLPTDVRTPAQYRTELAALDSLQLAVGSGFAYPELLEPSWSGPRLMQRRESAPSGLRIALLAANQQADWRPAEQLQPVYHRRADIQVQPGVVG